jgi:hypothetical protein
MRNAYGKKWYTPMEIVKLGLIQNSKGGRSTVSGNYSYVLKLIKTGKLRAKNYSTGTQRQNWLVPEDEIARYHDTVTRI